MIDRTYYIFKKKCVGNLNIVINILENVHNSCHFIYQRYKRYNTSFGINMMILSNLINIWYSIYRIINNSKAPVKREHVGLIALTQKCF